MTTRVIAVIPARGGSKGIPGKNLKTVGGVSLLARSINAAAAAARVTDIFVSSDDEVILAAAEAVGAKGVRRPVDLAGDQASSESALRHLLTTIGADRDDIALMLQCTSPFTSASEIDALAAALDDRRFDSALLVAADHGFLWRRTPEGHGEGINHSARLQRQRRQDMEPQYRETGAGYAIRCRPFLLSGNRFSGNIALVETSTPPLEIDDPDDLAMAELLHTLRTELQTARDLKARLAKVRVLITDFDGVHTDDTVGVDQNGVESVRCSRSDGMGVERLRRSGMPILILSKERNPVVIRRAEKLQVEVIGGCDDKVNALRNWLAERGMTLDDACYVGNDINDLESLRLCGLAVTPNDAHRLAKEAADLVLSKPGGHGAVREICERLLDHSA